MQDVESDIMWDLVHQALPTVGSSTPSTAHCGIQYTKHCPLWDPVRRLPTNTIWFRLITTHTLLREYPSSILPTPLPGLTDYASTSTARRQERKRTYTAKRTDYGWRNEHSEPFFVIIIPGINIPYGRPAEYWGGKDWYTYWYDTIRYR